MFIAQRVSDDPLTSSSERHEIAKSPPRQQQVGLDVEHGSALVSPGLATSSGIDLTCHPTNRCVTVHHPAEQRFEVSGVKWLRQPS